MSKSYGSINGNVISSTWRTYLAYIVNETPTSFEIEASSFGVELTSSTYILMGGTDATMTLKIGSQTISLKYKDVHPLHNDFFATRSEYIEYLSDYFSSSSKKVTIPKTTSTQNVTVSFAMYVKTWNKGTQEGDKLIYGNDMPSATSTASVTLTVPAIVKPTVVLTALRDDTDESTVSFTATVSSFSGDNISSVKLTIDGTEYDMGSGTIDSSGSLTLIRTITGLSLNKISASLVATGLGGASDSYTLNIPAAFHVLDIGNKGKEIAFGQSATTDQSMIPSNGLFSCGMSPIFYTMAGEIKMWAGDTIPYGWLLCDGSEVSKTDYPYLYEAIGDLWGVPNSSSNFKLPNLTGRVPVGYNSADTDFGTVGRTGGEKTHKLTVDEMPAHSHTRYYYSSNWCANGSKSGYHGNDAGTKRNTGSAGKNVAHNNLQPYAVVKYIICAF